MIILNLKGGIGNQLFQYALGRQLAILRDTELKLDVYGLDRANAVGDIYRPFALQAFNIKAEVATPAEVQKLKYPYGVISKGWRYLSFKISRDKNTLFNKKVLDWGDNRYVDGYWQSPLYFSNIREILLKELTLKEISDSFATLAKQIKNSQAISLHVRRGDYAQNATVTKEFGACSLSYYQSAPTEIAKSIKNPTYFIFSDDMNWVKENLSLPENSVYVSDKTLRDVDELILMSLCQHNIIANSSFSWWGAWLNQNPDKVVIAPTPWFDKVIYDQHLIDKTWVQLSK